MFVLVDRRLPSSINEVGPSNPARFHGGEGGRGVLLPEVPASFRRFDGGPLIPLSWSCFATPLLLEVFESSRGCWEGVSAGVEGLAMR